MKEVRLSRETFREASILLSLKAAQPIKCFTCNTFITDSESAKSLADLSSEWEVMISPAMNERLLYAETQRSCLGWVMRALLKWAVIAEEERGENHYSRGCLLGVSSHSWGLTKGLPTEVYNVLEVKKEKQVLQEPLAGHPHHTAEDQVWLQSNCLARHTPGGRRWQGFGPGPAAATQNVWGSI